MDNKISDYTKSNYKELLVNKTEKKHVYFFEFFCLGHDNKNHLITVTKGYYIIDEGGSKWISIGAISGMFNESYYETLRSKFFDINKEKQNQFFNVDSFDKSELRMECFKTLISIIKDNVRQGSPRKFITNSQGLKINIEMPYKSIDFKFLSE